MYRLPVSFEVNFHPGLGVKFRLNGWLHTRVSSTDLKFRTNKHSKQSLLELFLDGFTYLNGLLHISSVGTVSRCPSSKTRSFYKFFFVLSLINYFCSLFNHSFILTQKLICRSTESHCHANKFVNTSRFVN